MKTRLLSFVAAIAVLSAPNLVHATGSLTNAVGINTLISAKLGQISSYGSSYASSGSKTSNTSYAPAPKVLPTKVAPTKTETIYQPVTQPVIQPISPRQTSRGIVIGPRSASFGVQVAEDLRTLAMDLLDRKPAESGESRQCTDGVPHQGRVAEQSGNQTAT